ncbi:hypothetical protein LUZ63_003006 [Rhynchospora breviuscula]|uniref:Inhibitor I9 domain-containing protein n=1 Tax=Rhynchospora breviuscula TaxID=2022672 RepID=A0A9Q0HYL7_9POAL|nr:hypothetical protein LUZ63_003006 [Rhynchospora breviuscula]
MNSMRNIQSTAIVLLLFLSLMLALMAEARNVITPGFETEKVKEEKDVYIVDIIRPKGVDLEKADIHVLVPVLGSKKAAKEAIIYHYKVISGFAAKLTPSQVKHLKKQPGVLRVEPDRISTHLMYGPGGWLSGAV